MDHATSIQLFAVGSGLIVVAAFLVLPLTVLFTLTVVRLFRDRVDQSMRATAGGGPDAPPPVSAFDVIPGTINLEVLDVTHDMARISRQSRPLREAQLSAIGLAAISAAAASIPSLFLAVTWFSTNTDDLIGASLADSALSLGVIFLVFTTPAALAFTLVLKRQTRFLIAAVVALLLILWVAGRLSKYNAIGGWFYIGGIPTLFLLLLSGRRLRAVAPVLLAATTVLVSGAAIGITFAVFQIWDVIGVRFLRDDLAELPYFQAGFQFVSELFALPGEERLAEISRITSDPLSFLAPSRPEALTTITLIRFWLTNVVAVVLAGAAAWILVRSFARNYELNRASDQMLQVDAVVVLFTIWSFLLLGTVELAYLVFAPMGFAMYWISSRWLMKRREKTAPWTQPRTLLLLRVFGFRRRTQRLLEDIGDRWRFLGPIRLIGGPDVADSTLEPHEFFEYLNGRISRAFIASEDDLNDRTKEVPAPDLDGLFRIEDFFCHDDTWQMTVSHLSGEADVVAMDLRGFSAASFGCEFEIEQLVATVPLRRVVLLIDKTTDMDRLELILQVAWQSMPEDSPNLDDCEQRIRVLRSSGRHSNTLDCLLGLLTQSDTSKTC